MRSNRDEVLDFVEQLLRTGCVLTDLIGNLLDQLPDGAFPGENPAEVLIEMLAGTVRPVAEATGAEVVRAATALIGAAEDRAIADLRAAANRAG